MWRDALGADGRPLLDARSATATSGSVTEQSRAPPRPRVSRLRSPTAIRRADLQAGARAQNAAGLERLARSIHPRRRLGRPDSPASTLRHVREIADRAPHRDLVHEDWQMGAEQARPGNHRALRRRVRHRQDDGRRGTRERARSRPVHGRPGDGRRQVRRRDREEPRPVFAEADSVNGVLFFDEADALFGKRSEVGTRTTGTPTSRPPTFCSAWRRSTGSPSLRPTSAPTSMRRSRADSTQSSTSRCPTKSIAASSGTAAWARACRARTISTSTSGPRVRALRRQHPQYRFRRGVLRPERGRHGPHGGPDARDCARVP